MPDTIKIGVTGDLEQRIKQLDNTSVALPYAVEVPNADALVRKIHEGLDHFRIRENREFFSAPPEQAKSILQIAEIMGGKDVTPVSVIVETPLDEEALKRAKKKRKPFNFAMLNITPGTTLHFQKDKSITCEVLDDRNVKFRDETTSLSKSAGMVLTEMGYDWPIVQGPRWWCLDGNTLANLRQDDR